MGAALVGLALLAEFVIALLVIKLAPPLLVPAALHVTVVLVLAFVGLREVAADAGRLPFLFATLLTAVGGPIGAAIGLIGVVLLSRRFEDDSLLSDWYERIALASEADPVTQLADRVAIGRALNLAAPPPPSFRSIIAEGTLAHQQATLGLIARDYHASYAPALQQALRSPTPVIRVQAAAVAAKVRSDITARLDGILGTFDEALPRPADSVRLLVAIEDALASSLVDEAVRARANAMAQRLVGDIDRRSDCITVAQTARDLCRRTTATSDATPARLVAAYEGRLLAAGRFVAFRQCRKATRLASSGAWSIRRLAPVRAREPRG